MDEQTFSEFKELCDKADNSPKDEEMLYQKADEYLKSKYGMDKFDSVSIGIFILLLASVFATDEQIESWREKISALGNSDNENKE